MRLELSPRRWILSPIAIKARDLDGNALLAFVAAERGFGVLLGNAKLKNNIYAPRGFVIEKNLRPGKATQLVEQSRANGHKVGAWCDEGLIYKDAQTYRRLKFDQQAYELLDAYFTWGKNQASDLIEKLGCSESKIRVTGNPRFDLHRPDLRSILDDRAAQIRRRHGAFILVNTKFSTFNGFAGSEKNVSGMRARGMLQTPDHEEEAKGLQAFQASMFAEFMQLIEVLSRQFAQHCVVVRPHPSEDHEPWRTKAVTLPNVKVLYQGNVAEWIVAADVCIHNNCTTGVEAYLLGKPSIAYRPVCDPRYDLFLPNALSSNARDLDQLVERVSIALRGGLIDDEAVSRRAEIAHYFIANTAHEWASDRIIDRIEQEDVPEAPLRYHNKNFRRFSSNIMRYLRPLKQLSATDEGAARDRFAKQKFDRLSRGEVLALLKAAQRATGRFANVEVAQLEDDVVCVY